MSLFTTPANTYSSDDGTLTTAEKNDMITDLGGALRGTTSKTLKDVEDEAAAAQSTANTAVSDASSANTNANTRCLDSAAIKTTGAQSKAGVLSFTNVPKIQIPQTITYGNDDIMRYADVIGKINDAVEPIITPLTSGDFSGHITLFNNFEYTIIGRVCHVEGQMVVLNAGSEFATINIANFAPTIRNTDAILRVYGDQTQYPVVGKMTKTAITIRFNEVMILAKTIKFSTDFLVS